VYLRFWTLCGRLAGRVLICYSILVSFTYWSFVYGAVSWFTENGFRVMLMYRGLELSVFTWCIYIVDLCNYMLRCSFVASTDVVLYLFVLLGMD
jgi:hypothetical protein